MAPIVDVNLKNENGLLVVELRLTKRGHQALLQYFDKRDAQQGNNPPRGLLGIEHENRMAWALDFAHANTDVVTQSKIMRLRDDLERGSCLATTGLRLTTIHGREFNLGPIHIGRRRVSTLRIVAPTGA